MHLAAPLRVAHDIEPREGGIGRTLPSGAGRRRSGASVAHQMTEVSFDPTACRIERWDRQLRHCIMVAVANEPRHSW